MTEQIESGLNGIYLKYRFLWFAVFSGMVFLILVAYFLSYFEIILPIPVVDPFVADKVTLIILFILLIIIFFLKRSFLLESKLVEKGEASRRVVDWVMFHFLDKQNKKHMLLAKSILVANSLILLIWFLADLVVLVAFVHFILAPFIKTFLLYSFVGLYSMLVNFPSLKLYKKIVSFID